MAMTIYPDCQILSSMNNNCWICAAHDLCSSCKVMGCTNEEKDYVIGEMTVAKKKRSEETYEISTNNN